MSDGWSGFILGLLLGIAVGMLIAALYLDWRRRREDG